MKLYAKSQSRYAQYGDVSSKTDVYAFGVVLYELISVKEAIVKTNDVVTESKGLVSLEAMGHRNVAILAAVHALEEASATEGVIRCMRSISSEVSSDLIVQVKGSRYLLHKGVAGHSQRLLLWKG
ncbi:hypothetical protein F0562_011709 [Nyssa sinensis]|uniref:DUF6857 domain-containing protein n=1 Tax=Nyssa sinensis TaxID=561372 RepID=A0A5J4ZQ37_9ASTE|nr:hypothetical protein F0562_011709 [Nyssa sinensis]